MTDKKYLYPIFSKIKKRTFLAFDTEDDSRGNMILGNIFDGEKHYFYKTPDNFMEILGFLKKKYNQKKIYLVATNLEYDMINSFRGYYDQLELLYSGKLINFRIKGTNIYGFDSYNHYKESIETQGERLNFEKIKIDTKNLKDKSIVDIKKYNARDTEILYKSMDLYQKSLNTIGCELKDTIAGSAMNLFRRNFLSEKIKKIDDNDLIFFKRGYYGGRTEIFNLKLEQDYKSDIKYIDINSLYPSVMYDNYFPVPESKIYEKSIDKEGMSEVEIEYIGEPYIPFLPYHRQTKTKGIYSLIFPIGKFSGVYTNFSLRYGVSKGIIRINKIIKSINFTENLKYFENYVDELYRMRKNFKKSETPESAYMSTTIKLLLNSLYGKFFEKIDGEKYYCDKNGIIKSEKTESYYPNHTNGIWSCYITDLARIKEYEGLINLYNNNHKIGYCDTDSIIYKGDFKGINISDELGDFKNEGNYKYARFYLPKTYILVDKNNELTITAKGIPTDKNPVENELYKFMNEFDDFYESVKFLKKDFHKLEFIQKGVARFKKPVKFRESYKSINLKANYWREVEKNFLKNYDKRIILKNGETRPIKINQ
jgi:hypothetical protein